jgi:hypothetical protein
MKLWLLVLSVVGFSVLASGQSVPADQGPSRFDWSAQRMQQTGPTTRQLQGAVRIAAGRIVITADEADVQSGPAGAQEVVLRGNVHLSITPRQ